MICGKTPYYVVLKYDGLRKELAKSIRHMALWIVADNSDYQIAQRQSLRGKKRTEAVEHQLLSCTNND